MPLELLEQAVERWIVSRQFSPSVASGAAPHVSGVMLLLSEVCWKKNVFVYLNLRDRRHKRGKRRQITKCNLNDAMK